MNEVVTDVLWHSITALCSDHAASVISTDSKRLLAFDTSINVKSPSSSCAPELLLILNVFSMKDELCGELKTLQRRATVFSATHMRTSSYPGQTAAPPVLDVIDTVAYAVQCNQL